MLIVGVAGGSGSGKTTVARRLIEALPPVSVRTIQFDSYYRDRSELTPEQRETLNYDHPDALETELLVQHLEALRGGHAVQVPIYDFKSHRRSAQTREVTPSKILIVEGILALVDERLRNFYDIKLFVDTAPDIRAFRRIRRDMQKRGRSFESIREQYYATVRPMHEAFVEPSKRHAHLIIPEGGRNEVALDIVISRLKRDL